MKFVPVAVRLTEGVPISVDVGEMLVSVGAGASTSKLNGVDDAPMPLTTVTG
jgi:hypothetical protein